MDFFFLVYKGGFFFITGVIGFVPWRVTRYILQGHYKGMRGLGGLFISSGEGHLEYMVYISLSYIPLKFKYCLKYLFHPPSLQLSGRGKRTEKIRE